MIVFAQLLAGATLCPFFLLFGCRRVGSPWARGALGGGGGGWPPLGVLVAALLCYTVPFIAQMPANNSMYSQLLERAQSVTAAMAVALALCRQ